MLDELGADGAPLLADGVALDARQALEVAEEPAAALGLALALQRDGAIGLGVEGPARRGLQEGVVGRRRHGDGELPGAAAIAALDQDPVRPLASA